MTKFRTPISLAALLAAGALVLAGCGGSNTASTSSNKPASTGSAPPQTASTTTETTTATGTATTPATTTSTTGTSTSNSGGVGVGGSASAGTACTAADLTPSFLNSNGATGHVVIAFVLRNSSSSSCHSYGYPGVVFLSRSGAQIATDATRTTTDFAGHVPETAITLQPGQEASFRLVVSDVGSSQSACVTAHGLQIIAPDDTATMKATMPSGISVCNGKATVSPLAAGTSASST